MTYPHTNTNPNADLGYMGTGIMKWKPTGAGSYRDLGEVQLFEYTPTVVKLDRWGHRTGMRSKVQTVVTELNASFKCVMQEWSASNLVLPLLGLENDSGSAFSLSTTANIYNGLPTLDNLASVAGMVAGETYAIAGTGIPAATTFLYTGAPNDDFLMNQNATATTVGLAVTITRAAAAQIEIDFFGTPQMTGALRFIGMNAVGPRVQVDMLNVTIVPSTAIQFLSEGSAFGLLEFGGDVNLDVNGKFATLLWDITAEVP